MALNRDTEEFNNVSAPLGSLPDLQAQTQEHMAAIARIPLVKFTGLQPAGLNASSEGEIRVFYDSIKAFQEAIYREPLTAVLNFIQLSEFGEIDPDITFDFVDLWQLDDAGEAAVQKTKADTDTAYLADGVITPEEVRQRVANDKKSQYQGLDLSQPLPEPKMPEIGGGEEPEGMNALTGKPLKDPASRLATSLTGSAARFGGAVTGGFKGDLGLDNLVDKETAKYTDSSTTQQHCADCSMFIPPKSCDTVEGTINPEGWCKFFEWKDPKKAEETAEEQLEEEK